ncbi:cytochrome P450 [Spongiactinospora gelatinilytica]|uniref:Cytochrome P450 n=1 Tax=Spongiactinospora gelatinilytica TaxID=2666298 RepID=A0A2W2GWI7_9ACTN|nr:cytochrome P450 [Spongiactinospora gelatinilytica]PZG31244.1 cytochrome P450 [Spongiactinospora gelatinilytica]
MPQSPQAHRFPFQVVNKFEPPDVLAGLRAADPVVRIVLPFGLEAWLVTRHADVRAVAADPRFSKQAATTGGRSPIPMVSGSKALFWMDPPEHTRVRKIVSAAFTARRIQALRPRVERLAADLVDRMIAKGPPADLITEVALPLPLAVICELLGVPGDERERFQEWADQMLFTGAAAPGQVEQIRAAREALDAYLSDLIGRKKAAPTPADDMLTMLLRAHDEDARLTEEEMRAFSVVLLVAGYHTTTGSLTHAIYHLLRDPARYRLLHDQPELIPGAVEELLRYSQIGSGIVTMRVATEDVEIGGAEIKAGEAVLLSISSANRDGSVFPDADTLDLARADNPHLTFGHGIHFCLGAQLGRLELGAALSALVTRLPKVRLAIPDTELSWPPGQMIARPVTFPLTW